ncbi:hypothetical protein N9878_00880 [bacterium]|nr:hypothetical protein [bacterium]
MKAGDKFTKPYPFKRFEYEDGFMGGQTVEGWGGGCHERSQDGPAVYYGQCMPELYWECDGEGFIEYEVLAIADMPRKYDQRVIYTVTMTNPDKEIKRMNKAHTVTMSKFLSWVESGYSSYPHDYEVIESEED